METFIIIVLLIIIAVLFVGLLTSEYDTKEAKINHNHAIEVVELKHELNLQRLGHANVIELEEENELLTNTVQEQSYKIMGLNEEMTALEVNHGCQMTTLEKKLALVQKHRDDAAKGRNTFIAKYDMEAELARSLRSDKQSLQCQLDAYVTTCDEQKDEIKELRRQLELYKSLNGVIVIHEGEFNWLPSHSDYLERVQVFFDVDALKEKGFGSPAHVYEVNQIESLKAKNTYSSNLIFETISKEHVMAMASLPYVTSIYDYKTDHKIWEK